MSEVTRFPQWRQAVLDAMEEFKYGDLITHEWMERHFGMLNVNDGFRLTSEQFRDRQFEWLANVEQFKSELLKEHQICLQSVRGKGYRWVPPHEQTGVAVDEFQRDARRVFRATGQKLRNLRLSELSDDQRRANMDALAKFSALKGMAQKALS